MIRKMGFVPASQSIPYPMPPPTISAATISVENRNAMPSDVGGGPLLRSAFRRVAASSRSPNSRKSLGSEGLIAHSLDGFRACRKRADHREGVILCQEH